MKQFFMTFGAEDASKLNDQILDFSTKNGYVEIERSAPAVAYFEGFVNIVVTSTFVTEKSFKLAGDDDSISLDDEIDVLGLSVRTYNCLRRAGIDTVGKLLEIPEHLFKEGRKSDGEFFRVLGHQSIEEVLKKLSKLGLKMKQ